MTYRDDAPSLRAECERLRAEVAGLRAKLHPPMRLVLRPGWHLLAGLIASNAASTVAWIALRGWSPWRIVDLACLTVAMTSWSLAFVRRVPAEGARS